MTIKGCTTAIFYIVRILWAQKSAANTFTICVVSTEANMQLFQIVSAFLHFSISNKVIAFLSFMALAYHKSGTHKNLVDPTEDKKGVQKKADKLGFALKPSKSMILPLLFAQML